MYVSTDLVFDGEHAPYREDDPPAPLSVYGRSKAHAETALQAFPRIAIVRVSLLYGPSLTDRPTVLDRQRQAILAGEPLTLFDDEWRTPLDLPTAARALLAVAESDYTGILHVGGLERLSRLEMGERLAPHARPQREDCRRLAQSRRPARAASTRRVARFGTLAGAVAARQLAPL